MPLPPNLRPVRARKWQRITEAVPTISTPPEVVARMEASKTGKIPSFPQRQEFCLEFHSTDLVPGVPPLVLIPEGYWLVMGKNPAEEMTAALCLLIPHPSMSRLHAAICVNSGLVFLHDYHSTNGSCIILGADVKPIQDGPHEIPAGAHISMGSCFFNIVKRQLASPDQR